MSNHNIIYRQDPCIRIKQDTKEKLDQLKMDDRETYNNVIKKLLKRPKRKAPKNQTQL